MNVIINKGFVEGTNVPTATVTMVGCKSFRSYTVVVGSCYTTIYNNAAVNLKYGKTFHPASMGEKYETESKIASHYKRDGKILAEVVAELRAERV